MTTPHSQSVSRLLLTLAVLLCSVTSSGEMEDEPEEFPATEPESAEELTESLRVSLSLKVPSGLWALEFREAHQVGKEVRVYWRLTKRDGMGTMAITTVSASKVLNADDLPDGVEVQHYVTGKTWGWENETEENVYFIDEAEGEKGQKIETVE